MSINSTLATNDPEILLDRIRQAFPDLHWDAYRFIDAGWDHEVIQLDDAYIFRFPNSSEYLALLHDEIGLLSYLRQRIRSPLPHYTHVAPDFSFAGYPMLAGSELSLERFRDLSDMQQASVARTMAEFLSSLHSVPLADVAIYNVSVQPNFAGYGDVAAEAELYLKPSLARDEYETVTTMLHDITEAQGYTQPARLIHGDLAPKHLIWNNQAKRLSFIDFSDRSISDPAYDFAELYTYGEPFAEAVYDSYAGPDKSGQFLSRAKAYMKAIGVHSLASTYKTSKMERAEALRLLDIGSNL